ncbi:hypothetical protein GCM10027275_09030 [Rhabdobacter roseus]
MLLGTCVQAQFEVGQRFVSGAINLGANAFEAERPINSSSNYSHSFSVSLGKFTRENRATGWSLYHRLNLVKVKNIIPEPRSLTGLDLGVSRFVEFYKPLGERWTLFARPSLSVNYRVENSYAISGPARPDNTLILANQTLTHRIGLSASLSAGVLWRFAPKWALEGNVAGITPLSITFGRSEYEDYGLVPNTTPANFVNHFIQYETTPRLSTGYVGLGFRYFY